METYTVPQFPPLVNTIHIALFHNVTNAPAIRKRLIQAATTEGREGERMRGEVDFAFLEGKMLVSRSHLLIAIQTTLLTSLSAPTSPYSPTPTITTRSHNLHSELLLALSPNNNITDSIRRHGIADGTTSLVVVRIGDGRMSKEEVWKTIEGVVEGTLVSLDELDREDSPDWQRVDKVYKLAEMNNLKLPDVRQRKVGAVINAVAIKSVT